MILHSSQASLVVCYICAIICNGYYIQSEVNSINRIEVISFLPSDNIGQNEILLYKFGDECFIQILNQTSSRRENFINEVTNFERKDTVKVMFQNSYMKLSKHKVKYLFGITIEKDCSSGYIYLLDKKLTHAAIILPAKLHTASLNRIDENNSVKLKRTKRQLGEVKLKTGGYRNKNYDNTEHNNLTYMQEKTSKSEPIPKTRRELHPPTKYIHGIPVAVHKVLLNGYNSFHVPDPRNYNYHVNTYSEAMNQPLHKYDQDNQNQPNDYISSTPAYFSQYNQGIDRSGLFNNQNYNTDTIHGGLKNIETSYDGFILPHSQQFHDGTAFNYQHSHKSLGQNPLMNEHGKADNYFGDESMVHKTDRSKPLQNIAERLDFISVHSSQQLYPKNPSKDQLNSDGNSDLNGFPNNVLTNLPIKKEIFVSGSENTYNTFRKINNTVPISNYIIHSIIEEVHQPQPYEAVYHHVRQYAKSLVPDNRNNIDESGLQKGYGIPPRISEVEQLPFGELPEGDEKGVTEAIYNTVRRELPPSSGDLLEKNNSLIKSRILKEPLIASVNNAPDRYDRKPSLNLEESFSMLDLLKNKPHLKERTQYDQQPKQVRTDLNFSERKTALPNHKETYIIEQVSKAGVNNVQMGVLKPGKRGSVQFLSPTGEGMPALRVVTLGNNNNYHLPKGIRLQPGEVIPGTMGLKVPAGFRAHVIFGSQVADSIKYSRM